MKVRVERRFEILIKICEFKCTKHWAHAQLSLANTNQQLPGVLGAFWDTRQIQKEPLVLSKSPSLWEPGPTASEFLHH